MSFFKNKRKKNFFLLFLFIITCLILSTFFQKEFIKTGVFNRILEVIFTSNTNTTDENTYLASTKSGISDTKSDRTIKSPKIFIGNNIVKLDGESYNLISSKSFHNFLQNTNYKMNTIRNVLITELTESKSTNNIATKKLKETKIDYNNLLVLQTSKEKNNNKKETIVKELFVNSQATYISSYGSAKENESQRKNTVKTHKQQLNKNNLLELSLKMEPDDSPFHMVRSLEDKTGYLAAENTKKVIFLRQQTQQYFDVVIIEINIYVFDKFSKLPLKTISYFKNTERGKEIIEKSEILYSEWDNLERIEKPFGIDF